MDNISTKQRKSLSADIHDKVARIYYSHGLFCSSHPYSVILATLAIFTLCCYPLIHLPLLGSSSQQFSTSIDDFVPPDTIIDESESYKISGPRWFRGPPVSYVQQIIIRSAVSPWKNDLILTDAFRAPLSYAFHINELINNYQSSLGKNITSLNDVCLQVSEPTDKLTASVLPSYGCLVISPSSIWRNNLFSFKDDADIIKTIFEKKDSTLDASSFREILFGIPLKETGIKKLFVRNRPRIITFAFTIVFQSYNANFLQNLFRELRTKFPSIPYAENITYDPQHGNIYHIQFQDLHTFIEFLPLCIAYVILFLYIYFSVCKIDLVKSKWALAISAVLTVVMSLFMSVGLCLWFGLNPTLNGSEILPYLIVVIGLENMLVLTKSVLSTPMHLDVKLRVAQGLSKEGWSITKNLLTELALLMIAFLTFVPKIQEFCLFAVVGLLTDFFLQLVFFATFLSIDIRRMEITDLQKHCVRDVVNIRNNQTKSCNSQNVKNQQHRNVPSDNTRRNSLKSANSSTKVFAPPAAPVLGKLPKRLKFVYFWARTRMVQRGLMICLVMWLFLLLYSSGLIEKYTGSSTAAVEKVVRPIISSITEKNLSFSFPIKITEDNQWSDTEQITKEFSKNIGSKLQHHKLYLWQNFHPQHWTTLFGYYNISLSGRFISILPPFHISIPVSPATALDIRHPNDLEVSKKSHWHFLSSDEVKDGDIEDLLSDELPYHPSSPGEVALAIALAIPSFLFLVYLMVILYRCMCSKHYAEWRTSWKNSSNTDLNRSGYSPDGATDANLVMETFPIKLHGHTQELEYLLADSVMVISACLDGNINVWDSISGECLCSIRRSRNCNSRKKKSMHIKNKGSFSSDSTYGSSPQSDIGEYMNVHKTDSSKSLPFSPTETKFPKVFNFDNISSYFEDKNTGQMYDFSKFIQSDAHQRNDLTKDMKCDNNNHSIAHEYQLQKEADLKGVANGTNVVHSTLTPQAIWSIDQCGPCIAVGCKEGRIELWNAFSGNLEYAYEESRSGVSALCLTDDRLVAARINGFLEFFAIVILSNENESQSHSNGKTENNFNNARSFDVIHCSWLQNVKAHSLAVSALEVDNGLIISGGYDRLVKVFKTDSTVCIYTLHGHTAPISVLNIDQFSPSSAASGCQDGLICLWDLMTGTCMYSLNGHLGAVVTLQSTDIYMISQGTDNRICIWEKCQGHLLHCISQDYSLHCSLILLTDNIMVTTKEDNLVLWDVNHGESLRMIMVGSGDHSTHIRLLRLSGQSVVCDYGPHMFIINFPAISDKSD